MESGCAMPPSRQLLKAIGEFNRHEWFECHETLEDLWIGKQGEIREFYQGVLQIAVALHHWRNGNFGGATSLLEKGIGHLHKVSPVCQSVDVNNLVAASNTIHSAMRELGQQRMSELPQGLIPKLRLVTHGISRQI